jgi:hypothetical protein
MAKGSGGGGRSGRGGGAPKVKTVTVTFQISARRSETATFEVYREKDLSKDQFYGLVNRGAEYINKKDWADDDFADIEKQAAKMAGIARGEDFVILRK